jgi:hypothetical protein
MKEKVVGAINTVVGGVIDVSVDVGEIITRRTCHACLPH